MDRDLVRPGSAVERHRIEHYHVAVALVPPGSGDLDDARGGRAVALREARDGPAALAGDLDPAQAAGRVHRALALELHAEAPRRGEPSPGRRARRGPAARAGPGPPRTRRDRAPGAPGAARPR